MRSNKLALGAIIGAATGLVAGVLTAPKSGRETREDLLRKAEDAKFKAASRKDELLFKAEEITDDFRSKVNDTFDTITSRKK